MVPQTPPLVKGARAPGVRERYRERWGAGGAVGLATLASHRQAERRAGDGRGGQECLH